jgi:hypothetical protein
MLYVENYADNATPTIGFHWMLKLYTSSITMPEIDLHFSPNGPLTRSTSDLGTGNTAGADPGFQVRGAHLKKLRRAEGGAKIVGVFRAKNYNNFRASLRSAQFF